VQTDADFADGLEIFFGDASDALCRVYARLPGPQAAAGLQLRGRLTGPTCQYAETLQATYRLEDRGAGDSLVAEAIVPEPSFWTPEMPHLYRAQVELVQGGKVVARAERHFGIRTLGAGGRKLIYDGQRWVLRGVRSDAVPPTRLSQWRENHTAMIARGPDDALCEEASRVGVLIVAELDVIDVGELRRLSRWPAVAIVAGLSASPIDPNALVHNLILAQQCAGRPSQACAGWAKIAFCEVEQPDAIARWISNCPLAAVAVRRAGPLSSVAAGRAECDRLQRDLAGHCEPAGYIV
jgi:hypothetical protein